MTVLLLASVSFVSWFVSLLAGGGSPLLLIPLVSFLLGLQAVAPVITVGLLIGHLQRIYLFQEEINWESTYWYMPGAIAGAGIGAYVLKQIHWDGLQIILGLVLVGMALYHWWGRLQPSWAVQAWLFLPMALVNGVGSSLIGSTGPLTNPVYLQFGLQKEEFLATKSLHTSVLHLAKILSYLLLGLLQPDYFYYGMVIGVASFPANWLAKKVLAQMSAEHFTRAVFVLMAVTGVWMVWDQWRGQLAV
ncbi:sulfite exporter TauE/SafE family protein [Lyngbya confervoides]|uniref:Probable membrane transporter protein n=1 Tax=Lyngbya confervoides BDU141951 TaxID=1574623 RepID=A0ABD4T826_9CYAN|nr:sulfite exporter TauE/SafE family protein [Lyngbya confervoides]MCM1984781.1 sulfite exporter TauE/SafE family protein [Lyngbya confervoides BDU141951]